jgi:hypothetical protein
VNYRSIEDYPYILIAKHIAEIMSWSKRRAYEVMEFKDFPLIRIGSSKRVRKDLFLEWLDRQMKS